MTRRKLLTIVNHRPTALIAKGEYTGRYYNPGNFFDEIHLVMTNMDHPSMNNLKEFVGDADLFLYNLPRPNIWKTGGWQLPLIQDWTNRGIELARKIRPDIVRAHNNHLEGYLAQQIKRTLQIPYVISIHHEHWQHVDNLYEAAHRFSWSKFESSTLKLADAVIAVHGPNLHYAIKKKASNPLLLHNVVSNQIKLKTTYSLSQPAKLITVNRQFKYKNPTNILKAIADIDCFYFLVGDGEYHQGLVNLAKHMGISSKVEFAKSMKNSELVKLLPQFDLHITHSDFWAMSKTVIEASLAGLPTIVNKLPQPVPEYSDGWLFVTEGSPEGYNRAIKRLLSDSALRENLGQRAYQYAKEHFDPVELENKIAQLYSRLIAETPIE